MNKNQIVAVIILFVALITTPVVAAGFPKVLADGFDQYLKEGPKAAIETWTKGSAIEGSKEALSQANNFRQIQDFYGNYIGYNVIKMKEHSSSSSVYFVELKYEKGNLFSTFYTYKRPDGKVVVTTFNFNTIAEKVWPISLVAGCNENGKND